MSKKWFSIDERIRFLISATFVMFLRFLIFSALGLIYSPVHYQIILAITWATSSIFAFVIYKFLVFTAPGNHLHQYLKSLVIWTLSYFFNTLILMLLIDILNMGPYISQAIAISFLLLTNYLLFKHFAFKHSHSNIVTKIYDILD